MEGHGLPPGIAERIVIEHGDRGERANEFMTTAAALLAKRSTPPRVGQTVAYCVREALVSLAPLGTDGAGEPWRDLSRRVVESRLRYERALDLPETASDAPGALAALLRAVDDLALFHESDRSRRRSLVGSIVDRSGEEPNRAGERAVQEFLDVLEVANSAVHTDDEVEDPGSLYDRALSVLAWLYTPAQTRFGELEKLASVDEPGEAEVARLNELVLTAMHLQRFLRALRTVKWLDVLTDSGALDPPEGHAAWPAFAAVDALVSIDPAGLATWLERLYDRCQGSETQLWQILRAAHDIGAFADPLTRRVLARHAGKKATRDMALTILLRRPAPDTIVQDIADHLLNDHGDGTWEVQEVARRLVKGITPENGLGRLRLLTQKLKAPVGDHDRWRWLSLDRNGSIAELSIDAADSRVEILIAAVIEAARSVLGSAGGDAVAHELERLPTELGDRIRSWLTATDTTADPAATAAQIEVSMSLRGPSADDLALIDRVVERLLPGEYLAGWTRALGPAPSGDEVAQMIAGDRFEPAWARAYEWLGVLPADAQGPWAAAYQALCSRFGTPSRDSLLTPSRIEVGWGRSPYEVAELAAMTPARAAALVGAWRPDTAESLVGPLELARTVQAAVVADPARWLENPRDIAATLREPIHIDHYLHGITEAIKADATVHPELLMDVIDLVLRAPWAPTPMGRRDWDFEPDWSSCRDAAIRLLRAMADKSIGFAGQDDHVWDIIKAGTAEPTDRAAAFDDDPLTAAINHPATRALEAAISFMAYQLRTTGQPQHEALSHIEQLLKVDGARGARIRAIVASRLRLLLRVAPDFVSHVEHVLLGDAAPPGLAQLTTDLALHWDGPNRWLLERHRARVRDAVIRGVENAVEQVLVAYLWQLNGYALEETVKFLASKPGLTSEAGEVLGRMLRDAEPEVAQLGVQLWKAVLARGASLPLAGFGWFAEVAVMDNDEWSELTLETMRASTHPIDWPRGVATRISRMSPTPTALAILDDLIRHPASPWSAHPAIRIAVEVLGRASHLSSTVEYQRLASTLAERGELD